MRCGEHVERPGELLVRKPVATGIWSRRSILRLRRGWSRIRFSRFRPLSHSLFTPSAALYEPTGRTVSNGRWCPGVPTNCGGGVTLLDPGCRQLRLQMGKGAVRRNRASRSRERKRESSGPGRRPGLASEAKAAVASLRMRVPSMAASGARGWRGHCRDAALCFPQRRCVTDGPRDYVRS